ncbi:LPXTG cell wall anchor domain-containing protein [Arthrobacter sp. SW1]|uniref:LPXTG cell wall anchor domain-containing protein n=1 Tax=Arthrobacter sp. SW1 TaxID=1920889 RepID=UPI0011131248|nr:LPXTG cell wall anchor domain-containing protein [Arthrobacter sp. SW1]
MTPTIMNSLPAALLAAGLAAGAALASAGPAQAAPVSGQVLELDNASFTVTMPAPGHSNSWHSTVRNISGKAAALYVTLDSVRGSGFEGKHPATLALREGSTVIVPATVPATRPAVRRTAISLGVIGPGQVRTFTADVALPAAAGNEYRDAAGQISWRFSATPDAGSQDGADRTDSAGTPGSGWLPHTGAGVIAGILGGAAALTAGLLLLWLGRRKRGTA